jgi:hypothetical protein
MAVVVLSNIAAGIGSIERGGMVAIVLGTVAGWYIRASLH